MSCDIILPDAGKIVSSSLVQLFDFSKFRELCLIYM
jgi:hypothetical protein